MQGEVRWWLKPQDGDGLLGILARLDRHGLSLLHEPSGEFRQWGTDVETAGRYWPTTPEELVGAWTGTAMPQVAFQLWTGLDQDVFVTLHQYDDRCELSFGLDGFSPDDGEKLAATLFWNAVTTEHSIAVIIDALFDFLPDWPLFVENPALYVPRNPRLFWIKDGDGRAPFFHAQTGYWWYGI